VLIKYFKGVYILRSYVIGIDVGATWTRIALANKNGMILHKHVFRTPRNGDRYTIAETISENIIQHYKEYLDNIEAIGIGTAGPLELSTGMVINSPNIPIRTFELGKPIQDALKKPVIMANDCVTAVWGEKNLGLGKEYSNIVYITISSGIGGGMIVNDTLLLGKMGNAHEIGHTIVDVSGKMRCGCGGYGHWEAYASGVNIPRFAELILNEIDIKADEKTSPIYRAFIEKSLSTELIYSEANKGDRLALKIINEINRYNIAGFENIINLYDPELITLGGSVILKNRELAFKRIVEGVAKSKGIVTSLPKIEITAFEEDIVLVGAIALAIKPPQNLIKMLKYLQYF
jgi:glucokinase